jgi:uncharacterized SAM-binding protein YcdF (DUF218 family)
MEFLDYLRPALKAAILPPGGILLLLLFGLLIGRRLLGRLLVWTAFIGLYLLSTSAATHWLAQWLETYPAVNATALQNQQAQAILVLTAGYVTANPELGGQARPDALSLERLSYAVKLHRETGLPIVISGGKLRAEDEPIAEVLARWLHRRAGIDTMALETRSTTTWENLQYSASLLQELGLQRIALVTHAFHMPRSMLAAQAQGLIPIPAPFGYLGAKPGKPSDYTDASMWKPGSRDMLRNYLLLHELLGISWYQFKS